MVQACRENIVNSAVKRKNQMKKSQTARGKGTLRKTIKEVIRKDLEMDYLDKSMVINKIL